MTGIFWIELPAKIIEMDRHQRYLSSPATIPTMRLKEEQLRAARWNAYLNQQQEIKHQEAGHQKNCAPLTGKNPIKRAGKPGKNAGQNRRTGKADGDQGGYATGSSRRVLSAEMMCLCVKDLGKAFGSEPLFDNLSLCA